MKTYEIQYTENDGSSEDVYLSAEDLGAALKQFKSMHRGEYRSIEAIYET